MINKLYGQLVANTDDSAEFYRMTTQSQAFAKELAVLVPPSSEVAYIQFCADQLCGLVSRGLLRDKLQELDPHNTYDRPPTRVAGPTTTISGVPEGVTVSVLENNNGYLWVDRTIRASFDGVSTVTYGVRNDSVEWGSTGTPIMSDGGIGFTFNGPAPIAAFVADLYLVRTPSRDLLAMLNALDALEGIDWSADLEQYRDATVSTTRIAAYILNMLARI